MTNTRFREIAEEIDKWESASDLGTNLPALIKKGEKGEEQLKDLATRIGVSVQELREFNKRDARPCRLPGYEIDW